ncbi:MAG: M48 family metalloprotease [Longimicrobiales bacterium]
MALAACRRPAALAALGALFWGTGCATNPVTGETELALISEQQEIQLGQQTAQQVAASIGLVQDDALQAYVQRVGETLARASERPRLPWTFRVVDDPTPNAFALPGGYIFLTRGMLALMDSEAELAAVLGHEIGHVTARHSVNQISRAQLAQIGLGIGGILVPELQQFGGLASAGLQLLFLKYGRDDERQADELGFAYAGNAGYDLREMDDVFASLQRIGEREGRSGLPTWLSSHPAPAERIEAIRQRLAETQRAPDARLARADYLEEIEGLVYGENPRNGFFEGSTFLHPDLRFRLEFPRGWPTQNMAQAVVAGSPGQDALLQLTLAEATSADAAARAFFGQQGVRAGATSRASIGGLPAVAGEFQAQTQQGVLQGIVAFIEHGGRTYQLMGYAPAQVYPRYASVFEQTLRSFRTLNDPGALAVEPDRLEIVRIERAMTLAEFDRRYPSAVPIEELAIINQVGDPGATLAAATLVKRVTEG